MIMEIILIGAGLAMDAFAVAVCKGLCMKKVDKKQTLIIGLFFGGFQALMPVIGWTLGMQFERYITSIDHWIAFILLSFIGGKMIREALSREEECEICPTDGVKLDLKELFVLSIATSIDALAVGITFAFLNYPIAEAAAIIGAITFCIAVAGGYIGNLFGSKYKKKAELAGGVILVLIGLKILIEDLLA